MNRQKEVENIIIDFLEYVSVSERNKIENRQTTKIPFHEDLQYMKLLYGDIGKILAPYVESVVEEFDYEGSPIYNDYIDRHTINQMVFLVFSRGKERLYQVEEIYLSDDFNPWGEKNLLRQLIQTMILNEVYSIKRHNVLKYNNNNVNDNRQPREDFLGVEEVYFGKQYKLENYAK